MNEPSHKRKFTKKLSRKIESQVKQQKQKQKTKIVKILSRTSNLIILFATIGLLSFFWQQKVLLPLLTFTQAMGGDYFNALTYANFIARFFPIPPTGWMPFWNNGIPIIGGYFTAFFYLMYPLTKYFDVATSMELASAISLLLFLIFSHVLFWEISRNHIVALVFTMIIGLNPATYYSLVGEGLVAGSAMQWYLPLSLFLIIRFIKFQQFPLLLISSAVTGIAITSHPAMGLLTVFLPCFLYLITADTGDPTDAEHTLQLDLIKPSQWVRLKTRVSHATNYILFSMLSGITGLYALTIQSILSTGSLPCNSQQCWGQYPQHLSWFTPLLLPPIIIYLFTAISAWIKQKKRFSEVIAPFIALLPLILYLLASWLQLINPIASAFFPRRIFWAMSVLGLAVAASAFRFSAKVSQNLAIASIAFLVIAYSLLIPNKPDSLQYFITNKWAPAQALPFGLEEYIVAKYQTKDPSELIPEWLPTDQVNFRIDSIRPDFFIWWNILSDTPSTRGYSNIPTQEHIDWLYYLQTATQIQNTDSTLSAKTLRNRTLFLLDSFGIKYIHHTPGTNETGLIGYDPQIIQNQSLIKRSEQIRDWTFFELEDTLTSPIVTPSNATRILTVTDEAGYETLQRVISLTALNNKHLITIKAAQSIDKLSQNILDNVDAVILYRFRGSDWKMLESFIQSGGNVFADFGSLEHVPEKLPKFIGIDKLEKNTSINSWSFDNPTNSSLLSGINLNKFSPPIFEKDPWKIISPRNEKDLHSQTTVVLSTDNIPILVNNYSQSGNFIFSGINLPYHAVQYQNENEAQLFENILDELIYEPENIGEFSLQRPHPSLITASAKDAKGILFKENHHPGWKATINGESAPIYRASLGFMYIPIPQADWQKTNQISLKFKGSFTTWTLPLIALTTIFLIVFYALIPSPFRWLNKFFFKKVIRPTTSWWTKDQTKY